MAKLAALSICTVPDQYHSYWYDYGRCLSCKQELRHEMHLYNHYRKYHWREASMLRYYVWYDLLQQWVQINERMYASYKRMGLRPTAIAR